MSNGVDNKLNDPLSAKGNLPSVGEALGQLKDVAKEQRSSIEKSGELEAQKLVQKPKIEAELLQAQKQYRDVERKKYEQEVGSAERDMSEFKVSQDSISGMSALGTAILMMGQLLGKTGGQQSAMGAIQGMTGMMQGYSKGRADEFKRNQVEFERNFKILQDKIKRANDKFQAALAEMPYNTIEAQTKAAQALAELDSPILKEQYKQQGLVITANTVGKVLEASNQAANRANALNIAAGRLGGKPKEKEQSAFDLRNSLIPDLQKALPVIDRLEQEGNWKYMTSLLGVDTRAAEFAFKDDKEALELIRTLSKFRSKEFETAGKALTAREDQILKPLYQSSFRTYEATRNAIEDGIREMTSEQENTIQRYPQLKKASVTVSSASHPNVTQEEYDKLLPGELYWWNGVQVPKKQE
jgi:hypothetical protein